MTQNSSDVEIANQGFAAFRQDLNDVLEDITTLHSGTAAPSTTYANMLWYETDSGIVYIRNNDNDAWIEIFTLDQVNDKIAKLNMNGGEIVLDADDDTSITADTDDRIDFKVAGSDSVYITSSGLGVGDTAPVTPLTIATTNKLGSTFTGTTNGEGLTVTQTNYTSGNYVSLVESAYDDSGDTAPNVRIGAMYDSGGSNLAFGTSNSFGSGVTNTAMFIDSSGNIGVNNSSPNTKIDVIESTTAGSGIVDTLRLRNTGASQNDGARIQFTAGSSTSGAGIGSGGQALNSADLRFYAGGNTERMRIDSSGNVGIGTSSPSAGLHIDNPDNGAITAILDTDNSAVKMVFRNNTEAGNNVQIGAEGSSLVAVTGGSERMRIDNSGHVGIGQTSPSYPVDAKSTSNGDILFRATHQGSGSVAFHGNYVSSSGTAYWGYWIYNGSVVGSITSTGSSTSYNTSSDYRLKENVTDITDGIERIKQLNPSRFNFIADADTTVDGFLAHEAQTVVPEAITGEKDAMRDEEYEVTPAVYEDVVIPAVLDDDGNEIEPERTEQQLVTEAVMGTRSVPDYQGIDQAKLVPLLTASLQEAIAKIEDLETRVAALEN